MKLLNVQVFTDYMENTTYDINRAIHLARCEVFFETSVTRARECLEDGEERREAKVELAIYFLQSALEHAVMASKSPRASPQEKSFVRFLQLVLCYLRSASALMENEQELKDTNSQLWRFLSRKTGAAEALGFSRSSEQLLQDVVHLFAMAADPLRDLRQNATAEIDETEHERYRAAQTGLREHLAEMEQLGRVHVRPNFLFNS